jgi:hypothetical protein
VKLVGDKAEQEREKFNVCINLCAREREKERNNCCWRYFINRAAAAVMYVHTHTHTFLEFLKSSFNNQFFYEHTI